MSTPNSGLDFSPQAPPPHTPDAQGRTNRIAASTPPPISPDREHGLNDEEAPGTAFSLPPVDSGFDAYAYLASAWLVELLVWSFPVSYGVFLNYYTSVLFLPDDPQINLLPIVGTLSSGIIYVGGMFIIPLMIRYPGQKRNMTVGGLVLCVLGLVGAGFSTRPAHLVLTQGIIYALGGNFFDFPVFTYMMEWFVVKRGMASGILFSGTCLGGVAVPFITEVLLRRHGHRITFFIFAAVFAALGLPSLIYAKPRLPAANASSSATFDTSFVRNKAFWLFITSIIVQALGEYLPFIYLPSFASDIKLSATSGTLALSLMNGFNMPGVLLVGAMSDRLDLRVSISFSTIGCATAILLIWGFSAGLAPLLVFACLYGFFAAFSVLWPRFISKISVEDPRVHSTLISLFSASRGVGCVLSGPLSTLLLRHSPFRDTMKYGYGVKGYGSLILFSGVCMVASTAAATYPYFIRKTIDIDVPLSTLAPVQESREVPSDGSG